MDYQTTAKLILFDLDGTLAPMDQAELYPDAAQWLAEHPDALVAIVSNQGSIGLRYWQERDGFGDPSRWQTEAGWYERIDRLFPEEGARPEVLQCFRYQSKKTGAWCPVPEGHEDDVCWSEEWRKPAPGMLLYAMGVYGVTPAETLMVGDDEVADYGAAVAAGCAFMSAKDFFGRAE